MTSHARRSTLQRIAEAQLQEKGTSLEVFLLDGRDEGKSYQDLAFELRELTKVPVHPRTVERWVAALKDAA